MFNKDFYPTPNNVIEQMLIGIDIQNKIILEPSAGKGNIVNYLHNNGVKDVIACELNKDLAKIVSSKCRLIKEDFLEVRSEEISHIDLIVMNPPFSADEKHILHAWDIAPGGCQIIALCNIDTIQNDYTRNRQILSGIIKENGYFNSLEKCFSDAERQTNVDIACVYLTKPKTGDQEFEDFFSMDEDMDEGVQGIVKHNYVREIVGRYVQAVSLYDNVINLSKEINKVAEPIFNANNKYNNIVFGARYVGHDKQYTEITRDVYKKELQKSAWRKVFDDLNMDKYITKGVRENINAFVEKQTQIPFTVKNIYKMVEIIAGTHGGRMNQVLIDVFELICSYSSENSTAGEKWKTNSDYMINKKFIVPGLLESDFYGSKREHVYVGYGRHVDEIEDIIKALCHATGTNYDACVNLKSFVRNDSLEWGQWYDWEPFFKIKGYKKGTMHFQFLNDDVWMNFNIAVAKAKGWQLPKKRK